MDVTILDMPELRVFTVEHTGPYNQISHAFERLGALAGLAGLFRFPAAMMLATYHDDPETTAPDQLRSEAAVSVPEAAERPKEMGERRIPAGRYARTVHVGPYERLGDSWARFKGEWLPQSGERMGTSVSYEIYRNNPTNTPKEELITELLLPLF
jgi:AraC family transcriptional regulator